MTTLVVDTHLPLRVAFSIFSQSKANSRIGHVSQRRYDQLFPPLFPMLLGFDAAERTHLILGPIIVRR